MTFTNHSYSKTAAELAGNNTDYTTKIDSVFPPINPPVKESFDAVLHAQKDYLSRIDSLQKEQIKQKLLLDAITNNTPIKTFIEECVNKHGYSLNIWVE